VPCLAALWLLGVLLLQGRLFLGFVRVQRMTRRGSSLLPERLQTQLKEILSEVGFTRPIAIVQASHQHPVSVPMIWGVRPATLLLPTDAGEWPAERLRVVALHELAHIRRHDWLTQMLGQFVCALYWFHPLVWLLHRRMQIEAEHACDDAVLLAGVRAKEYARHLLDVVKAMQAGKEAPVAAVAMARPTQVRDRLQSILNVHRSRQSTTRSVRTLVLLATALLLCAVSGFRPLAWAKARRQVTNAAQTPPSGPVVTLPNGISVELAGVGSDPLGNGDDWWTPDGNLLLEPPTAGPIFLGRGDSLGDQYLRRALFFRLHATQDARISTTGYVVDPTNHLQKPGYNFGRDAHLNYDDGTRNHAPLKPGSAATGITLLGFPPHETQCTYRYGVASGPWETIATTRFALQPTPGAITIPPKAIADRALLFFDDNPRIEYGDAQRKWHMASLLGGHSPLGEVARRLIALDKDGKQIDLPPYAPYGLPTLAGQWARVAEIQLQTRPYQWAEFKEIHLQHIPVAKFTPIATPPALPAFRHTFACGVTLGIHAVTESRKEGGGWWTPDGKGLAGPLKEWWAQSNFPAWGQEKMRTRVVLLKLKNPRPMVYTTAVRFSPAFPEDRLDWPPGFEMPINVVNPIFTGTARDFPRSQSHTAMRYGIAAGPWKSVARIPMPQDVRHTDDAGKPAWSDITLEIPGYPERGETPALRYTASDGKNLRLSFRISDRSYLSDVARRFVAVDKDGKIIPLSSNNTSHLTPGADGKPILLDPAHADKNDLRVRDYQRREFDSVYLAFRSKSGSYQYNPIDLTKIREFRLEVRPYEWAEFPNIALQPTTGDAHH